MVVSLSFSFSKHNVLDWIWIVFFWPNLINRYTHLVTWQPLNRLLLYV